MRLPSRRSDDADVIRARLRALLADRNHAGGWVPEDDGEWAGSAPWSTAAEPVPVPAEREADDVAELPRGIGRHRAPDRTVRWDPGRGGARSLWAAAVLAAVLLVGCTWWDRPRVEPVGAVPQASSSAPPSSPASPPVGEVATTAESVVVSVVGLVARPGLVTLPSGSRVAQAVDAAGGLLPGADPATVNLAAVLTDGEQIAVGVPAAGDGAGATTGSGEAGGRVDLNTADAAELDALPGIGPVLAQRIVDHRTRHGPFRSVDELDDVPGIGPTTAAELAELVSV